jgi:hypothetical protein
MSPARMTAGRIRSVTVPGCCTTGCSPRRPTRILRVRRRPRRRRGQLGQPAGAGRARTDAAERLLADEDRHAGDAASLALPTGRSALDLLTDEKASPEVVADRGRYPGAGCQPCPGEPDIGSPSDPRRTRGAGYRVAAGDSLEHPAWAGLDPAPWRTGPSWWEFCRIQARTMLACDFFTVDTVLALRSRSVATYG